MKRLFLSTILCAAVMGCAGQPKVDVKKQWSEAVGNYSFVPLYPMREDVFVGDVRIHRIEKPAAALDSRFLANLGFGATTSGGQRPRYPHTHNFPESKGVGENNYVYWDQNAEGAVTATPAAAQPLHINATKAVAAPELRLAALPKIDAARFVAADVGGSGVLGAFNFIIGGAVEKGDTVLVAPSGVETVEVSDLEAVSAFHNYLESKKADPAFRDAICAAAVALGDRDLDDIGISVVTRVIYARGIDYAVGDTYSSALRASVSEGAPSKEAPATLTTNNEAAPSITISEVDTLGEINLGGGVSSSGSKVSTLKEIFDRPMAFGVDAHMIDPAKFDTSLPSHCQNLGMGFTTSPRNRDS